MITNGGPDRAQRRPLTVGKCVAKPTYPAMKLTRRRGFYPVDREQLLKWLERQGTCPVTS